MAGIEKQGGKNRFQRTGPATTGRRANRPLTNPAFMKDAGFSIREKKQQRGNQPLKALNHRGQEALFAHVLDSRRASITETVIDFDLREGTFNGFFFQAQMRLPIPDLVKAMTSSKTSCQTCLSTILLVILLPKHSARLGQAAQVLLSQGCL